MSHKNLIRLQTAFITRQENDYDLDIVDEYVKTDFDRVVSTESITYTTTIFPSTDLEESTRACFVLTIIGDVVI
jgi:hypothetical protein